MGSGPLLLTKTAAKWRTWRVTVIDRIDVRGYRVTLQAVSPPKSKLRCPGYLAVAQSGACPFGSAASAVKLVKSNTEIAAQWLMLPVDGFSFRYELVAAGRRVGCPRFLGASHSCRDQRPQLYQNDDRTGRQRWDVVVAGNPPPVLPRTPNVMVAGAGNSMFIALWNESRIPQEIYTVACMREGLSCDAVPVVASNAVLKRVDEIYLEGAVHLPSTPMNLSCYVIASNAAGQACSEAYLAEAMPAPTELFPTAQFNAFDTYVRINWHYNNSEIFFGVMHHAWCTGEGQPSTAPPLTSVVVARPEDESLVIRGLKRSTNYTCFMTISSNDSAWWFPYAEPIKTLAAPPRAPLPATDVRAALITIEVPSGRSLWRTDIHLFVSWKDGLMKHPGEMYQVSSQSSYLSQQRSP